MPAPLGLVIGRNDRWPRTKETPLEGHRGSTRIFLLLLVSSPLSRFSFDWNHRGRAKDQDRAKFRKRFERNLRKKEEKYPRGEDFAKRRRINYTEYLIFLLLLSLSLSSFRLEWMVDTKDQDRVENARRKRSWETVTKWTRKNLFVLLSPRKNGGTQKTENQDQENR